MKYDKLQLSLNDMLTILLYSPVDSVIASNTP